MMKKELYGLVVGDAVRVTDGKYKTGRGHVIDIFPETMEVEVFLCGAFNAKTAIVSVLDTESL